MGCLLSFFVFFNPPPPPVGQPLNDPATDARILTPGSRSGASAVPGHSNAMRFKRRPFYCRHVVSLWRRHCDIIIIIVVVADAPLRALFVTGLWSFYITTVHSGSPTVYRNIKSVWFRYDFGNFAVRSETGCRVPRGFLDARTKVDCRWFDNGYNTCFRTNWKINNSL